MPRYSYTPLFGLVQLLSVTAAFTAPPPRLPLGCVRRCRMIINNGGGSNGFGRASQQPVSETT